MAKAFLRDASRLVVHEISPDRTSADEGTLLSPVVAQYTEQAQPAKFTNPSDCSTEILAGTCLQRPRPEVQV